MCARVSNILDPTCGTAAIDVFVLADCDGSQLSVTNILDLASTFGVIAMIPRMHPKIVWDHFFEHWITPFGVPRRLIYNQGAGSA